MRNKLNLEINGKGWTQKERVDYINRSVDQLQQERKAKKGEEVDQRANELAKDIFEGLKNLKKLQPLETTINDGVLIQDLAMKVLDVLPEDVHLLASETDANQIIEYVRVGEKDSDHGQQN